MSCYRSDAQLHRKRAQFTIFSHHSCVKNVARQATTMTILKFFLIKRQVEQQFSCRLKANAVSLTKEIKKRNEEKGTSSTVLWELCTARDAWIEFLIYCYFLLFNQITLIEAICIINHMQNVPRSSWESQNKTTRGWDTAVLSLMHIITDQQVKNIDFI